MPGKASDYLSQQQIIKVKESTFLTDKELAAMFKRYGAYDKTRDGSEGIPIKTITLFPEFVSNPLITRIAEVLMDVDTGTVLPENFIYFLSALSSKSSVELKRQLAFQCFDVHGTGYLQYDEMFRMYKLFFIHALNDEQILEMVFAALDSPHLTEKRKVSQEDFNKLVPDSELLERFTVDLQYP